MFIPPSNIDILYDYIPILKEDKLCNIPEMALGKEIAIIGSGPAGLLAAHELLKIGLKPVIYEANSRMGGRLYSRRFEQIQDDIKPFAEMGAMRVPRSSRIFFHYAKKMGLTYHTNFPNPGQTKTIIYFRDKLYHWEANATLPEPFLSIAVLWDIFIKPLVSGIHIEWEKGNLEKVRQLWQLHIDQYKNMSFYQVLRERSPLTTGEQIGILGALGLGHGGFSPLFHISFLEILRLLINQYLDVDFMIAEGISEFINRLYLLKINTPFGVTSLSELNCVKLKLPVVLLDYNRETNNPIIVTKNENNLLTRIEYSAVIFTGSLCAAHLLNITNKTKSGIYLMSSNVREAIKSSPMIASSKTYICTETKFWLKKRIPNCFLTDDLTRSSYFLDYPSTKYGVVCLSYTWAMDAMKLHAVDPKDRVTIFKRALTAVYPGLNRYLEPLNNEVLNVDWINEKYQNGAFKIFTPGYDQKQKALYLQFTSVLTKEDKGVYLAGDSISWAGGWIEGALYTAINSVFAVSKRLGAKIPETSPLHQNPKLYQY